MSSSKNILHHQFKYYTLLSISYAVFMITAQACAYRLLQIGPFITPGGIFVFPATFVISDIISEVYGPTLARRTILFTLIAQAFYSVMPIIVNALPSPPHWHHAGAFTIVFGSSWLVFLSNFTAVLTGMVLNTQLIGRTKLLTRGRFFSIRSLCSSAIGELILTAIIVLIALVPVHGFQIGLKLFINMFLFKMAFSLLMIYPACLLVVALKKADNIDVYEENVALNPLSAFLNKPRYIASSNVVKFPV